MAEPIFVPCLKGQWTKVATSVVTGQIWKRPQKATFLQTYRVTGNPPPTLQTEGVQAFPVPAKDQGLEEISSSTPIDVYLFAVKFDGEVRVDL